MIDKIREKLLGFINSGKDTPLLAGFSIGLYMMLFYYARNFGLANSWEQLLFFSAYYVLLPVAVIFGFYKIMGYIKLAAYRRQFVFTAMVAFLSYFLIQLLEKPYWIVFATIVVAALLSIWIGKYYKLAIILLFVISLLNAKPVAAIIYRGETTSDEWKKQPDDIESVVFKMKPNIYYIQPDGYTNFNNIKGYGFDNSDFELFLKQNGFKLYKDNHSNYHTTLLSNSATFSMKQHFMAMDVGMYTARSIIVSDNPVLRILKNNGYKTSFITHKPYLLVNRPKMGYDYCNISYSDLPYIKDGLEDPRDVFTDLREQMKINGKSGNFYFVEKFVPGHIHASPTTTLGREKEKRLYITDLKKANTWLKEMVGHIIEQDPEAIIIIGADHGGFVGLDYTQQALEKTTDENIIRNIYGAQLSIKWNNTVATEYDKGLKSNINLFRTLFSYLAANKKYLGHLEDNSSYILLYNPEGKYKYIDNKGNIVFQPI